MLPQPIMEMRINMDESFVSHPAHYTSSIDRQDECIDVIEHFMGDKVRYFLEGNIIKYLYRYPTKGERLDLEKARQYIDMLIVFEYGDTDE